jgi:hypothetical protein
MSNSEPSAIVLHGIPCIGGLYISFDSNGEIGSVVVRSGFAAIHPFRETWRETGRTPVFWPYRIPGAAPDWARKTGERPVCPQVSSSPGFLSGRLP